MHPAKYAEMASNSDAVPLTVPLPKAPAITGLSRSRIYLKAARGNIRLLKVGRSTLVCMDSVRAFLASRPAAAIRAPLYRAVKFQATGRSKTRPLRQPLADAIGSRKANPLKPLQPSSPLDGR